MRERQKTSPLGVTGNMKSKQHGVASQIKDAQWHIETLSSPEHQPEAHGRLEYLSLMPKLALFCLLSEWLYLGYRIFLATKAPSAQTSAYVFLSIEVCSAATAGLLHLQTLSAWGKAKLQLPVRLRGDRLLPTVDVFLPCCGEGLEVILDTVRAACALDYPPESYRVVVLDDGCSRIVREAVERLSLELNCRNLHYTSRNVKVLSHSKAGNLNHGLSFVSGLPSGPSELVAVLDIDMIPLPHWLRTMLPYILADSKVGLANPAQRFYNIPDHDPFAQNLDIVFDGIETIKECVSSSWCTGTGFVVRRQALHQIQWFPTDNHCDDIMTSVYLTAAGWKIAYVPETVQWGLVPDTVRRHNIQRTRWTGAFIYSILSLWSDRTKGHATIQQRAGASIPSVALVLTNALIAFSAIAVPWILFTGSQTVLYQSPRLQILLYLQSLSFVAAFLTGFTRSRSSKSHGIIFPNWEQVGFAPFQIATIIRVTISELVGVKLQSFAPSFRPTPSDKTSRFQSLTQRIDVDLLAHLSIFSAHLAAGCVGLRTAMTATEHGSLIRCLFSKAGYPAFFLLWAKHLLQSGIPIPLIMSSRPVWPLRESLLVRDPVSKVAYPSKEATDPHRTRPAQTFAKLALCYHFIVFVSAWWIR